jgi:hypothetical protein
VPIIAYQSFNANSSTNHGLKALSFQRFTLATNEHVTEEGHEALVLPYNASNLAAPIEGPAHLRPIEVLTTPQTIEVFGAQISLVWQNFNRVFGAMPDIMVCGELDASNADFANVVAGPNVAIDPVSAKKACQSFTAISQTSIASRIAFIAGGEGYVVYEVAGLVVVFVHVPNRIATSRNATQEFYIKIAQQMQVGGRTIHLVIGDTNQPNFNFTAEILNLAFKTDAYENATDTRDVEKLDNYNVVESGTNSTGTKMYDVAVYRSDLVDLKRSTAYLSQSSSAVTITDHCGLGVRVELK